MISFPYCFAGTTSGVAERIRLPLCRPQSSGDGEESRESRRERPTPRIRRPCFLSALASDTVCEKERYDRRPPE